MSDDLRAALLADVSFKGDVLAKWRADRAVAIVAAWLRDEAHELRELAYANNVHIPIWQAEHLEDLAASLTRPDHTEEKRDG